MPRAAPAMLDPSLLVGLCRLAAEPSYFPGLHHRLAQRGIVAVVRAHDTPALFGWLVEGLSFQGISDAAALTFMDQHGRASWEDVARSLQNQPGCPKLTSHWHFHGCNFVRSRGSCAEPAHYPACPLPSLPLRNGALNRMAYGLFLTPPWLPCRAAAWPGTQAAGGHSWPRRSVLRQTTAPALSAPWS